MAEITQTLFRSITRSLITPSCQDKRSATAIVAVFTKIDALPRSQIQPPVRDRDGDRVTQHGRFQVSGHIIGAFIIVLVIRRIFGNGLIEKTLEIAPHGWIGIFIDGQAGGCVLDEHLQQPNPDLLQVRKFPLNDAGNQVKTARIGGQVNGLLKSRHMILNGE